MNRKIILNISAMVFTLLMSSCSETETETLLFNSVKNVSACTDKGGYWYNDKCWKDFEDDGILKSKIDSVVSAEMIVIKKSTFKINDQTYPLVAFLPIEEEDGLLLVAVYGTEDRFKTIIFPTGKKNIEKYYTAINNRNSWEGFIGSNINIYGVHDFIFTSGIIAYPGITEKGRWRFDYNINTKYKFVFDFYITIGFSFNFDNQPVNNAPRTDYALTTGLGWKWNK